MHARHFRIAALALGACLAAAGCNKAATPAGAVGNISGDYTGSVQDSVSGTLAATAIFAQHGASAGGTIVTSKPGGPTTNAAVSLAITTANALAGSMVIDEADGTTCTFSTAATYANNGNTAVISGSYSAVTNCSGETGTYTLNQQCVDTVTSVERRTLSFPPAC